MWRKSCTDDRYLQCLFCKLFNRDRYGNACRIIRRFTDLLQLYGPCNRFRPFLYFGEDGFCLVQRIQYNVAGIYTDCRWRDQDVTRHMEAGICLDSSVEYDRDIFLYPFTVCRFNRLGLETDQRGRGKQLFLYVALDRFFGNR